MSTANLTRACVRRADKLLDRVYLLFNPEEYVLSKANNFAQLGVPGLQSPVLQFINGNAKTLQMELFADSHEEHEGTYLASGSRATDTDVRYITRRLVEFMEIDPETHAPPVIVFEWGSLAFTCVIAQVAERYIMFRSDGVPVRARLQVTFHEMTNPRYEAKERKNETADFSHLHVVNQGETLSSIAGRVYANPELWRPIALRNRLDDPRSLIIGQRLLIPRLPFQDPETGEVMR